MIITIEDFPQSKSVKHITINISFDEDGNSTTKVKHDYTTQEPGVNEPVIAINRPVDAPSLADTAVSTSNSVMASTSSVAHVEDSNIPEEMRDIQF